MTLATADLSGKPEAATVEYVLDGDTLLLNTYTYYRKYQNLLDNPQVACVITTGHEKTLQFDARIMLLEGADAQRAQEKMLEVQPEFADFFNDTDTRFFVITPFWMRLRDYTKQPIHETLFVVDEKSKT